MQCGRQFCNKKKKKLAMAYSYNFETSFRSNGLDSCPFGNPRYRHYKQTSSSQPSASTIGRERAASASRLMCCLGPCHAYIRTVSFLCCCAYMGDQTRKSGLRPPPACSASKRAASTYRYAVGRTLPAPREWRTHDSLCRTHTGHQKLTIVPTKERPMLP